MSDLSLQEQIENDTPNYGAAKQILIADDEPMIRTILRLFLKRWGYRTLAAPDGRQALEVAEKHHGDIDVLVADMTMPDMGGLELADRMTKENPSVKVILMSGLVRAQVAARRGWKFVQKPFRPSVMEEAIKEVL